MNWSKGTQDLPAAGQAQVVVPLLQGHDPAVQAVRRAQPLAAEIVDHQRAAVALHLQRRFADARLLVDGDFQAFHRQFAADDDRGPADAHPAMVDLLVGDDPLASWPGGSSSWQLGSKRRMISPHTLIARGIQMLVP